MNRRLKKLWPLLAVVALVLLSAVEQNPQLAGFFGGSELTADEVLARAFENQRSDLQVKGGGTVIHILPDDNRGSRHQKFLLQLDSGQKLLVSHNIDLAPRISGLRKGDAVQFYGEYEWNDKGGVVHWTHHDPAGRHADGWLQHRGNTYQ